MAHRRNARQVVHGDFVHSTVEWLLLKQVRLRNAQGELIPRKHYKELGNRLALVQVRDVVKIAYRGLGQVLFTPQQHTIPMASSQAHRFREFCLSLLAQFPELSTRPTEEAALSVHHPLEDPHHRFWVGRTETGATTMHGWSTTEQELDARCDTVSLVATIAKHLNTDVKKVWVTPHPMLTGLRPLWTGKRRWTQSTKRYKTALKAERTRRAQDGLRQIRDKGRRRHGHIAQALEQFHWKSLPQLCGVSPYQRQNLARMKLWR
ncbi:hypothetical protein GQ600_5290 [Phytophthora cactorum]|nr:hypothetical protein GQ600_5290 [Phytophthora cactorum]